MKKSDILKIAFPILLVAAAIFIAPHFSRAATFECDYNNVDIGGDTGWYSCPGMDFSDQSQLYTLSGFSAGGTLVQVCSGNGSTFHGCGIFYTDDSGNLTFGDVYAASGDSWLHFSSGSDNSVRDDSPIYGTTEIAPSYFLNPVTPGTSETLVDFPQWVFSYGGENLLTTSDNYYVDVQYYNSDYSVYGEDDSAQFSGSTFTEGGANVSFNKSTSLPAGSYTAYATLINASNYNSVASANFSFTITSAPPTAVSLLFPTNGTTSPDFSNWVVGWSGDVPYGTMHIVYGLSSSSLNYDDSVDFDPFISANPLPIYKSQPLFFVPLAIPVTWYAQVEDIGASETVFSDIISFQINPDFTNPTSTATDTTLAGPFLGVGGGETSSTLANPTTNCQYTSSSFFDDPIGNIQNGICNALVFLFIPNSAEQTAMDAKFNDTWTQISNRVPFGYAGIIMSAFQGFQDGTTTSTLMSSSTYTALSSVLNPLKTGISFMLILLLAFAILYFVRTITL
jgi:hypothetical protein